MSSENAIARKTLLACATLLLAGLAATAEADSPRSGARQYGDAFLRCSEWTRLRNDPKVTSKPWPENVFLRYASWTTGFVTGASSLDPSVRTTSAADIIRFVTDYCAAHPKDSIGQASMDYVETLK